MSKLTLSVDDAVVDRAKRFAKQRGTSISRLVETYLTSVTGAPGRPPSTPGLRALRGILKSARIEDYRKHLVRKYR